MVLILILHVLYRIELNKFIKKDEIEDYRVSKEFNLGRVYSKNGQIDWNQYYQSG
jgi:hypothetical protein